MILFRPTTHRVQSKVGGSFGLNIVTKLIHKRLNCRIVKCHPRDTLEISKISIYTTWPRHSSWCCSSCTGSARGWARPAAPWWARAARSSRWWPRSPTCSSWRSSSCRTSRSSHARSSWTLVFFSKEKFELDMIGMQPLVQSALVQLEEYTTLCWDNPFREMCILLWIHQTDVQFYVLDSRWVPCKLPGTHILHSRSPASLRFLLQLFGQMKEQH